MLKPLPGCISIATISLSRDPANVRLDRVRFSQCVGHRRKITDESGWDSAPRLGGHQRYSLTDIALSPLALHAMVYAQLGGEQICCDAETSENNARFGCRVQSKLWLGERFFPAAAVHRDNSTEPASSPGVTGVFPHGSPKRGYFPRGA